ncbi:MAG: chitosanase [Anaerolineae bacterium]|nr:chitosanase [Anaerolineae bacterium]
MTMLRYTHHLVQPTLADDVPTPPSPTGQYPDPVWAKVDYSSLAQAASGEVEQTPISVPAAPPIELDNQEIYQIIRAVANGISGEAVYEYVDAGTAATDGLRVGLTGFRQANGELGQLLKIMQRRDPSLLAVIMGQDIETLLQVTNAGNQEARLQPVGGQPLWHQSWQDKFRQAGQQPIFQAAQNEAAIELQFRPLLELARSLDLRTDRGLAVLYDRAIALGEQAGVLWLQQRLPSANGASERTRLQALLTGATPVTQTRLENILNSSLLDDTTYIL